MTVRRERSERRWIAALFLIAPLFVAGCATPHTHFAWTYSDNVVHKPKPTTVQHASAPKPRCSCDAVPVPTARPAPPPRQTVEQASLPPPAAHGAFTWPARGRVISEFGSATDGQRNDGINIAVSEGAPIRAAADGTVTYSGNGLKNYGNLTLIKHDNGYATVYAHAENFVVSKGDHVARGQVIGYAGQTGDVSSPQLHFEIRRGAREPIDPRSVLGAMQMAAR
jgi:murein DD-endopeptidase MepM/ murein hydrolase activator NlpD